QFWATVKAKTVNAEVQLQALVDGKKVIITESTLRRDLQLEDAEGADCLPNATTFEQLTLMGSTLDSAIICLATNQKFNFSKYIFESMVRNVENVAGKFLMYPRFVQVFLDKQLKGVPTHKRTYVAPSHTKKIFRNMKRVGKGFSRRETPLFPTMMVQAQEEMGEGSANPTDPHHTPTIIQPSTSQPQRKQRPKKPKRKDTEIPQSSGPTDNVADEAVYEEMDDSLERAATTATSLDAEQDSGNINKTQSKATPNEPSSPGTSSGGGPKHQETMGDTSARTRFRRVSKQSNDPLLTRGNTFQSGEDSLKLEELIALCTTLQQRVLDLETTKTTQGNEIASLRRRVRKLEKKDWKRTHKLKRLYKGRIADIDAAKDIYLVNVHKDEDMFRVNDLDGDEVVVETEVAHEVVVETEVASKDVSLSVDEVTLAQALAALKNAKLKADKVVIQEPEQGIITTTTVATTVITAIIRPKVKGLVIHEEEQSTTPTVSSQQPSQVKVQDKGKGIMVEEPFKMKKKDQINFDEQEAIRLQAEFDEEERITKEKDEANIALTKELDDIKAKINADYQLAQRRQAEEQEELTDAEKARLFVQLLEKRRKHFAAKRAEAQRNKPPTKAQQKKTMITYLKNMEGWKHTDLRSKDFDSIKELFDKAFKRVNTFVDYRTELVEESSKKAEVMEENDDQEAAKTKDLMEIIPDEEEVAIDAIPLATKPPSIIDWKILKEGKIIYFQIIRADESSKRYSAFIQMLKSFDREDLETLWKLVKAKHGSTRLEEGYERVLWGDLKTMFKPHVEDTVWRNLQGNKVLIWKLFDSCRLSMKKLEILKKNIKFRGGLLGLKYFLMILELLLLRVNAAGIRVTTAERLQLLKDKDCLKIKITYEIRIIIYRIDL
ncbi:hypothetical protein Tco_1343391, partial [Tanacetum coccineum]